MSLSKYTYYHKPIQHCKHPLRVYYKYGKCIYQRRLECNYSPLDEANLPKEHSNVQHTKDHEFYFSRSKILAIWFGFNLCTIIWIDTITIDEPFNFGLWIASCACCELRFHTFVHFNVTNLLQECWRLTLWCFITVMMQLRTYSFIQSSNS